MMECQTGKAKASASLAANGSYDIPGPLQDSAFVCKTHVSSVDSAAQEVLSPNADAPIGDRASD